MSDSFHSWLEGRPEIIQEMARKYPPDRKYRLVATGQIGHLHSYSEEGTVTVIFPLEWNPWQEGGREVFGIDPTDLEVFKDA